jgi:hypothetical protein
MNAMGVYSVVVARSGQPATGRATEVALLGLCLVGKVWVKNYCITFRCYLVKFVQLWIN